MTLQLHDALRGEVTTFAPIGGGPVGVYVCGITPYDTGHLGHAFTYVHFDVLNRYLRHLGYEVRYVQNLTDVDDDMLRKAREVGEDYRALGNRNVASFLGEMDALNWLRPDVYPRATEHIEPMQRLIAKLLERGHAYLGAGSVFYDVASFPDYGALSRIPRDEMLPIANERGNVPDAPGKRDPLDFVLWQPSAPDEPSWDSPWGRGRPGWHIECSAMAMEYLGERFEIHGGGSDLVFPHHESEIAQAEGATGVRPFVEHWMHTGMVRHEGDKMSKSLGNLVLVRDLLPDYSAEAIRHYLLSHHFASACTFDELRLAESARAVDALRHAVSVAAAAEEGMPPTPVAELREEFGAAMDRNLDTPAALTVLASLAGCATDPGCPDDVRAHAAAAVHELGESVLGLRLGGGAEVHRDENKPKAARAHTG
ncbi:MAG: cysteine--tRNA ligase [Candidatus Limnocylindria bacterium]